MKARHKNVSVCRKPPRAGAGLLLVVTLSCGPGTPECATGCDEGDNVPAVQGASGRPPRGAAGSVVLQDAGHPPGLEASTAWDAALFTPTDAESAARSEVSRALDAATATDAPSTSGDGGPSAHASNFVFDDRKLSTWRIVMTDADLKKLDATALMEAYVLASLQVDNEEVGRVGVRYKGAYASFRACFVNGVNTCKKLSYKVDFAEYDDRKRFHSLKKINLHAQTLDLSHLNERLAYQVTGNTTSRRRARYTPRSISMESTRAYSA